jgi:hypothetical protein
MFCHLARLVIYTCWRLFSLFIRVERFAQIERFVRIEWFVRIEQFERFVRIVWRLVLCLDLLPAKDSLCCDAALAGS